MGNKPTEAACATAGAYKPRERPGPVRWQTQVGQLAPQTHEQRARRRSDGNTIHWPSECSPRDLGYEMRAYPGEVRSSVSI